MERDEKNEGKNDGGEQRAACAMIDPKARGAVRRHDFHRNPSSSSLPPRLARSYADVNCTFDRNCRELYHLCKLLHRCDTVQATKQQAGPSGCGARGVGRGVGCGVAVGVDKGWEGAGGDRGVDGGWELSR